MAEYCLKCFNIINKTNFTQDDVMTDYDICERCRKNLPCVIYIKSKEVKDGEDDI